MPKLKKWLVPAPLGYTQMFLVILIELLLIFGKEFSKFQLTGQLHLYDLLLLLLTAGAGINLIKKINKEWNIPILTILGASILYLLYSYFSKLGPLNYMVRQYALFVYLGCMFVIFYSYIDQKSNQFNIRFLALIGVTALALQIGYHVYNFIFTEGFGSIFFTGFNYYSLLGFMALFVFEAYLLVYINKWWKWPLLFLFFILSFTMGHHSSAIIGSATVLGAFIFIRSRLPLKIALFVSAIIGVYSLYTLLPEYFQDHNSLWRLLYWKMSLKEIVVDYYGILGHGFGVKFTSQEILDAMRYQLDSPWMEVRPKEQYLSPMHNSFITMAFHVGLIFVIVLFIPLKRAIGYIFNRSENNPQPQKDFLILSLIGVFTWSNFHVVLELPHSSAFFWLIYFTTVYHFNSDEKQKFEQTVS